MREKALLLNPWIAIHQKDGIVFRRLQNVVEEFGWDNDLADMQRFMKALENV